ncbi:hypothetical protein E4O04_08875 [Treponema sp. OMZ 799]|uniref:hypothetical protein n=1 Tax=Treponema sp. OMZ 799 TaxID=2563668 RepID=UPI0020A3BD40|nr:hypothetical protein [Treponema sp. OMZ 799]UTC78105.1 hypothetical protein E4O04_08875 [Treponema sp. OMZ 799]
MKRFVLIVLCAMLLACGKKEKGVISVENKSSHVIKFEFAQNYESKIITLQPTKSIDCAWERYFHCIIQEPNINLLRKQKTKEKITIFDNDQLNSYTVINGVCNLTILDAGQFLLADSSNAHITSLPLAQGTTNIKTFKPLSFKNIIFDESPTFNIGSLTYKQIEKIENVYYLNENNSGNLITTRLNIIINNGTIKITK